MYNIDRYTRMFPKLCLRFHVGKYFFVYTHSESIVVYSNFLQKQYQSKIHKLNYSEENDLFFIQKLLSLVLSNKLEGSSQLESIDAITSGGHKGSIFLAT